MEFNVSESISTISALAERRLGGGVRSRISGDDIAQIVAFKALRDADSFKGKSDKEYRGWLFSIANNTVLTAIRNELYACRDVRRQTVLGDETKSGLKHDVVDDRQQEPDFALSLKEQIDRVRVEIERLPASQAEAIRWRYLESLTLAETCERMSLSRNSVKSLVRRGLATLRKRLRENE